MQEQSTKRKNPFLLRFSVDNQPQRAKSFNRLNYHENVKKDGTFVAKKDLLEHQLFDHHLVKNNMNIQGSLKKLHATFIHQKVPQFYSYFFMNQLIHASQQKIQDHIRKQLQELKTKRSFYHVINSSIKARQGNIRQLHRCLDNLFNSQDDNVHKHVFRQQIIHYRKITSFVIGHIRSWKQQLISISPQLQYICYQYKGEDYLIKLLNDCEFIFNSFLSKHLKFSFKNDPYIMRPYADGRQGKFLQIFKYQESEKGMYMVDMNYLADQRAKYLSTKIHSQQDKIKEIQKIYQYKENPLSSRILIRKINLSQKKPQKQRQREQSLHNNFVKDEKKSKLDQISKKSQKMKRIKQIFGRTSGDQPRNIINDKMFTKFSESSLESPYRNVQKFAHFENKKKKHQNLNYESDFEKLLRKKQVQVLQNRSAASTQRSFKTIKINDKLSQTRKVLTKDEQIQELQTVLNHLQMFSPQKLDNFKTRKRQQEAEVQQIRKGLSIPTQMPKTLIQHNEQVYVKVRNQVIEEIERDKVEKQRIERQRRAENDKIQEILKSKINEQSIEILKNQKAKKLEGKEELAKQFGKSELFGFKEESKVNNVQKMSELEQELKKQMELKWLRQVQDQLKRKQRVYELEQAKKKDEERQQKQLDKIEQKKELERKYNEIQREQRAKAVKKQLQLDDERKRQIEQEMKEVLEREKQKMQNFAMKQRLQVQEQMRQSIKVTLLEQLKSQKQKFYDDQKKLQQLRFAQRKYREQVRLKLQEQYKLEKQMKNNRQKEQKTAKLRLIKEKLKQFDDVSPQKKRKEKQKEKVIEKEESPQKESKVEKIKPEQLEEMKSRITEFPDFRESVFPKYKSSQHDKKKLREQFECELFAFRKPQVYEPIKEGEGQEQKNLIIKDFRTLVDQSVKQKTTFKDKEKQKEQNEDEKGKQKQQSPIKQMKLEEIEEESNMSSIKLIKVKEQKSQKQDKFVRFSDTSSQSSFNEDEAIRIKLGMSYEEYQIYKKKKTAITLKRDIDEEKRKKLQAESKKEVVKVIQDFEKLQLRSNKPIQQLSQQDVSSLEQQRKSPSKKSHYVVEQSQTEKEKEKEKQKEREKRRIDEVQIITANSRISSVVQKKFMTSDEQQEEQIFQKKKKNKESRFRKSRDKRQSRYGNFKKKERIQQVQEEEAPKIPSLKSIKEKKTLVKVRQIPITHINEFFDDHFQNMPKVQKKINIYKKKQLIKFMLEQESFNILEYVKESVSLGLVILTYNSNKTKYRSMNIDHIGSYDENDLLDILINVSKFVFKVDPCQEITLSLIYEKDKEEQTEFMKKFQLKFDPYGSIFQKKIFNTQYQRKFVLRRNIGQQFERQQITPFNRGSIQLNMDFFYGSKSLSDHAQYPLVGYDVACPGFVANYLSQHIQDDKLAEIIVKSTESSDLKDKNLGHLAKLTLALKKDQSFMRLGELKQQEFSDIMSMNLQLNGQGHKLVPYPPQKIQQENNLIWQSFKQRIQLSYDYYSALTKIQLNDDDFECKYMRYTPNKKNKMFTINSSAYSAHVHILPTKHNKYKIFVLDSEEYDQLKDPIPLDIYLRVLFANVESHQISKFQTIWLPEIKSQGRFQIQQVPSFGDKNTIARTKINYSFSDYLGNSLKVTPTHRDLLVTPPYILGIMNMQIQKIHEGSPLYIQRVDKQHMNWLKQIKKVVVESD